MSVAGDGFCWLVWKSVREAGQTFPCGKMQWSRHGAQGAGLVFSVPPTLCNSYAREKAAKPPRILLPRPQVSSSSCWAISKFDALLCILGFDGLSWSTVRSADWGR